MLAINLHTWNTVTSSPDSLPPEGKIVLIQARGDLPCVGFWEKDFLGKPLWTYLIKISGLEHSVPCYDPERWLFLPD